MKKIFLTLFAAIAAFTSLSVFADNLSCVEWGQTAFFATSASARAWFADLPPAHTAPAKTASAPANETASTVTFKESIAVVDAAPAIDPEVVSAEPAISAPSAEPGISLVSTWLEVPRSVLERAYLLPALSTHNNIVVRGLEADRGTVVNDNRPVPPATNSAAEQPGVPALTAGLSQLHSAISDGVVFLPAPPPLILPRPSFAPHNTQVAFDGRVRAIETDTPASLPAAEKFQTKSHPSFMNALSQVSSDLADRMILLPAPFMFVLPQPPAVLHVSQVAVSGRVRSTETEAPASMPAAEKLESKSHPSLFTAMTEVPASLLEMLRHFHSTGAEPVIPETDLATAEHLPEKDGNVSFSGSEVLPVMVNSGSPATRSFVPELGLATTDHRFISDENANLAESEVLPMGTNAVSPATESAVPQKYLALSDHLFVRDENAYLAGSELFLTSFNSASPATRSFAPEKYFALSDHLFMRDENAYLTGSEMFSVGTKAAAMPAGPDTLVTTSETQTASAGHGPLDRLPGRNPIIVLEPETRTHAAISENSTWIPLFERSVAAASTFQPAGPSPVMIGKQAIFSPAMLKPLGIRPLPSDMLFLNTLAARSGGPSNFDTPGIEIDSNAAVTAKTAAGPPPVLINAAPGFSADMLKPLNSSSKQTPNPDGGYCDPSFVGPPIRFSQTVELKLEDLLNQLHSRFGVNFIIGPDIGKLPLNVKAGSIPWNVLLHSQLYISGVHSRCVDSNTIELVLNSKVNELQNDLNDAGELESRYIKLKYLQPSATENTNIAGQSSGGGGLGVGGLGMGCQSSTAGTAVLGGSQGGGQTLPQRCKFERLYTEIQKILGVLDTTGQVRSGGFINDSSGNQKIVGDTRTALIYRQQTVSQVPGRNMFFVRGTARQIKDIEDLIRRADIPPFQVVIKALVYTANESKLRDIGAQTSVILGTGNLNQLGGITSQPSNTGTSTGTTTGTTSSTTTSSTSGQLVPGGIRTLGPGFPQPLGTGDAVFGLSAIVGTAQFSMQVTALEQNGVISLKSRPFATVLDGDTTDLTVGRQVPVIIQAANNIGGSPGTLQILQAANLLSVTPHVIDDDNGNPVAVNLELRLESNDVDSSIVSQGVPSVSVRSIQSNFILNQEQTAILGGFTVDSDSKTVTKTPGLGDIPILGELFKRRVRTSQINRLYFAISVMVVPYGSVIEPVKVPGATTDVPTLTPDMLKRSEQAEPKQVPTPSPTPKKDTDH